MNVNLRREPRRTARGAYTLCWQDQAGISRTADAEAKDSSNSGLRVRSGTALAAGLTVFIQAPGGTGSGSAVVRHCTPSGSGYDIGFEFAEPTESHVPAIEVPDYYEFLQISPKASQETIHRIYRFMAARLHPDNPETGDPEAFLALNNIYEVLSDPQRRAEYDSARQASKSEQDSLLDVSSLVNGIPGEVNRRLAILGILYNKRRLNSQEPSVSLWELEGKMAIPREHLDFATWYLKAKGYISIADNSDFALTALGVDYVEDHAESDPVLIKLLNPGSKVSVRETDERAGRRRMREMRQLGLGAAEAE